MSACLMFFFFRLWDNFRVIDLKQLLFSTRKQSWNRVIISRIVEPLALFSLFIEQLNFSLIRVLTTGLVDPVLNIWEKK